MMTKKGQKQRVEKKEPVEKDLKTSAAAADDEEVNSGFGSYLRSSTGKSLNRSARSSRRVKSSLLSGQETLKLFVVVNSLVMLLTVAWPQMQNAFAIIVEFVNEKFGSSELF